MAERILVVGPPDVGKSTLSRALAAERGLDLLDLDVGQGDLPGAVTLFSKAGTRRLLVGRISPAGAEGWLLAASARLARLSHRGFVADTDGWLNARFRYQQAEALGAGAVVAFEEGLFAAFAWRKDLGVRRQNPLPGVRPRSPAERRAQRRARLQAHFSRAGFRFLPRPRGNPAYLFGLLDAEGFFLGYARLAADFGREALYLTPVRDPVARVVPTWVRA